MARRPRHAFITTGVGDEEKKRRIQEHTSGPCPYNFFLFDHLPEPQRTVTQIKNPVCNIFYGNYEANG